MSEDIKTSTIGTATARELAAVVGPLPLDELRPHEPDLAAAVCELAMASDQAWLRATDEPLIVLLRAVARLSLVAPDTHSQRAASLIAALGASDGRRPQPQAERRPSSPLRRPRLVGLIPQVG